MTIERKIVVGLEDVQAISFECMGKGCGYRVTMSPDKAERIPESCGQCGLRWWPENPYGHISEKAWPFAKLLESLRAIRGWINSGSPLGFKILLEFKEPN